MELVSGSEGYEESEGLYSSTKRQSHIIKL